MIETDRKDDIPVRDAKPLLFIVENANGHWVTQSAFIADKHRDKPGTVVTEYYSKL